MPSILFQVFHVKYSIPSFYEILVNFFPLHYSYLAYVNKEVMINAVGEYSFSHLRRTLISNHSKLFIFIAQSTKQNNFLKCSFQLNFVTKPLKVTLTHHLSPKNRTLNTLVIFATKHPFTSNKKVHPHLRACPYRATTKPLLGILSHGTWTTTA